jgi:T5SS/PEP-CTERM-associated repeat protein
VDTIGWRLNLMSKVVCCMGLLCALLWPVITSADTSWTSGGDGLWSVAGNWSSGLPNQLQNVTAIINSNTKMVRLDNSANVTNRLIQRFNLWNGSDGSTNTLLIDGTELTTRNTLTVDTGGALIISNNGSLNMRGDVGTSFNINAGSVDLWSGSIFSLLTTTRVGRVTSGRLTLHGGTADVANVLVGDFAKSSGTLLVNGGVLNVSSNLVLADDVGSTGSLAIVEGQLNMVNSNALLRIGDESVGEMTVIGGTVRLAIDELTVARRTNSVGVLTVAGGALICTDISVGRFQGATGTVMVTGGQLLATNDSLRIGREGFGQMLQSNGVVRANDAAISLEGSGNAFLGLYGGEMHLRSNFIANGGCVLDGGTLNAGQIYFTNEAGVMSFASGSLRSGGAVVANGRPFVVGDGVKAATYHMDGGVHEFANGLVISANATLSGCGTIIGTVSNSGTVATNCGVLAPTIVNPQYTGATMSFSFQTQVGPSYVVEFKNALTDAQWSTLETRVGDGSVVTITDAVAVGTSRFYRIRVQ